MHTRWIVGMLLAVLATSCATPTPYQPERNGYGYSEQMIEGDRFRIRFAGNGSTSLEAVRNAMLYRAAELTLERGGDYFVLLDSSAEGMQQDRGPTVGIGLGGIHIGGHTGISIGIGTSTDLDKTAYAAAADIRIRQGVKPADDDQAYDARAVKNNLGPTVKP